MSEPFVFNNLNLNQKVYLFLRNKILDNEFKPGTRLNFDAIATQLGVSKTPIRDAAYQLEKDGLVEIRSRYGTFVAVPKVKDIEEVYDVRKALERQL